MRAPRDDRATAYFCEHFVCALPVTTAEELDAAAVYAATVRDERQRRVGRPLVERPVVDRDRGLAEEGEREGRGGRGDAAAAVGDDARAAERRGEDVAKLVVRQVRAVLPVDEPDDGRRVLPECGRRELRVTTSPENSLAGVAQTSAASWSPRSTPAMKSLSTQSSARSRASNERGLGCDVPGLERAALGPPLREPAVEHGDAVVAEGAEQPPQAGRPLADAGVVDDHGRLVVDAELADRGSKRSASGRVKA